MLDELEGVGCASPRAVPSSTAPPTAPPRATYPAPRALGNAPCSFDVGESDFKLALSARGQPSQVAAAAAKRRAELVTRKKAFAADLGVEQRECVRPLSHPALQKRIGTACTCRAPRAQERGSGACACHAHRYVEALNEVTVAAEGLRQHADVSNAEANYNRVMALKEELTRRREVRTATAYGRLSPWGRQACGMHARALGSVDVHTTRPGPPCAGGPAVRRMQSASIGASSSSAGQRPRTISSTSSRRRSRRTSRSGRRQRSPRWRCPLGWTGPFSPWIISR